MQMQIQVGCTNYHNLFLMFQILEHAIRDVMRTSPEDQPVLLTEPSLHPKINREMVTFTMFEIIQVPAMYLANSAVLSLYASGRTTGIVFECGESVSHIVPIYEGHAISYAVLHHDLTGLKLTNLLAESLGERGLSFTTNAKLERVRGIKEKFCHVALDYEKEITSSTSSTDKEYELPDGTMITIGNESLKCPEAFFQPNIMKMKSAGIHEVIYNAIMKCDVEHRKDLYSNIILSGGSCMFPGMAERMEKEIMALGSSR